MLIYTLNLWGKYGKIYYLYKKYKFSNFRDIVPFNTKPYGGLWLTKYTEINANEWLMFLEEHPSVFFQKFNGEASIIE